MQRRAIIGGIVVAVLILIWLFLPSYSNVANLDSRGVTIIAFGDSLTAGFGAASGEDYPTQLAQRLRVPVVNAGVSGDTTEMALARLDADVLARDPRIIIVGLGGNDYLRGVPLESTEANLRSIARQIHGAGAIVVLLGFRFPSLNANYETMYERVAKEEHCLLIGRVLRGILTDSTLKSDVIHPNARGYALMADRIAGPMRGLIRAADKARLHRK